MLVYRSEELSRSPDQLLSVDLFSKLPAPNTVPAGSTAYTLDQGPVWNDGTQWRLGSDAGDIAFDPPDGVSPELVSVQLGLERALGRYVHQDTAARYWTNAELSGDRNIIGVRYAGPTTVWIPHDFPVGSSIVVRDEAGSADINVRVY